MKSTDHGNTWNQIDLPSSASNLFFDVGSSNSDELWVSYPYGQNGSKVYHTTDGGASWTNITTSILDGTQIWGIAHQYGTDGGVYIALLNGAVLYRNNSMNDWALYSDGLPLSTQPIRIVPQYKKGLIRLATWNLGVWEAPLFEPSNLLADFAAEYGTFFCPGDPIHFVDHSVSGDNATYNWSFPGGTPSTSTEKNPTIYYESGGSFDVTLTVTENGINSSITKMQYIESEESIGNELVEDFELGNFPEHWVFEHSTGGSSNWAIGNAASAYEIGSYSMYFDNYYNDVQGNRDEVWTGKQMYTLTGEVSVNLSFDVAYAEYGGQYSDTLGVLLSVDCGESWTEMYVKGGDDLATAPDNGNPFIPTETEWRNEIINLDEYFADLNFQNGEFIVAFQNRGRWGNIIYVDNINVDLIVGIDDHHSNSQNLLVYPNPTSDKFSVVGKGYPGGNLTLQLINPLGQVVFEQKIILNGTSFEKSIDISTLSDGMYYFRLVNEEKIEVIKVEKK
jgi:PKD repeat protein